jgi:hypothetical protein
VWGGDVVNTPGPHTLQRRLGLVDPCIAAVRPSEIRACGGVSIGVRCASESPVYWVGPAGAPADSATGAAGRLGLGGWAAVWRGAPVICSESPLCLIGPAGRPC